MAKLVQSLGGLIAWAIATILVAVSAPPALLLAAYAWGLGPGNPVLLAMYRGGLVFFCYLVFGTTLLVTTVVVSRLMPLKIRAGSYPVKSWTAFAFYFHNMLILLARTLFLPFVRSTEFINLFYRGLGAHVGRGVIINTVHMYDPPLLTIGDGAVIGGSAVVMAHAGERGRLVLEPVVIGKRASVGERAIVFPGANIGDGAVVGANSVVTKGTVIPAGEAWGGVPAQPLKR